jgi:hypothetical protein
MKCRRSCCNEEGVYVHSMTGELYCLDCTRKINKANPEYPNLIQLPGDWREQLFLQRQKEVQERVQNHPTN